MKTKGATMKPKVSIWIKGFLLILLAVQNAALTLFARMSRVSANAYVEGGSEGYAKTTIVVVIEATKIFVAFLLLVIDRRKGVSESLFYLHKTTFSQPVEVLKLLVPSSLYVLQNNLILVAADNLPGPVVAVLSQLKILTTAIFSVIILRKSLAMRQWTALFALIIGVASVQVSTMRSSNEQIDAIELDGEGVAIKDSESKQEDVIMGGLAALAAAMTSGFAGVYFEMVLKGSDTSVWVRNIHLALFGVIVAAFGILSQPKDMQLVNLNGFFGGYDHIVWGLVLVQAFGGLLVAAVVKYTDNILKAFATSASLVGVSIISVLFFNFPARPLFLFGTSLVLCAMFLYGDMIPTSVLTCLGLQSESAVLSDATASGPSETGLIDGGSSHSNSSLYDEENNPLIARRAQSNLSDHPKTDSDRSVHKREGVSVEE